MAKDPGFAGLPFPQRDEEVERQAQREADRQKLAEFLACRAKQREADRQKLAEFNARREIERRAQYEDAKLAEFLNTVVGDQSLPVATLVEDEQAGMSYMQPDPDRAQAAFALANRLGTDEVGELFMVFPQVQEAWLASGRDINRFKKDYPKFYERVAQNQSFAESVAEEEERLRRERAIARQKAEYEILFPREKLTGQRRKAAVLNVARVTGADPAAIDDHFEDIQAALAAADYDPEKLDPLVASVLTENPELKPVGLFDNPLKYAGRKLRIAVDTALSFLGAGYQTLGHAISGFQEMMHDLDPRPEMGLAGPRFQGFGREIAEGLERTADFVLDSRSAESIIASERMQGSGVFYDPRTWRFGDDPSVRGFLMMAGETFGSLAPMLLLARAGGPAPATAFGVFSEVGGATQEAEDIIDLLADSGELYAESQTYRDLIDGGSSHEEALAATKREARLAVTARVTPWALAGDAALNLMFSPMKFVGGKGLLSQTIKRVGVGTATEGLQEVGIGAATRWGVSAGAGLQLDILEDSFPNLFWGMVGGFGVASVGAARGYADMLRAHDMALQAQLNAAFGQIQLSEATTAAIETAIETGRSSDTAHADPVTVAKALADAAAESGAPIETVYLELDAAREIFGEGLPAVVEALTGHTDVDSYLMELEDSGSPMEIPLSNLIEFTQRNSEFDQGLLDHLTYDGGLSRAELRQLDAEVTELADALEAQEAQEVQREAATDVEPTVAETTQDAAPRIEVSDAEMRLADTIYKRLIEKGHSPKEASRRTAILRAMLRTIASREGLPIDKVLGAYIRSLLEADAAVDTQIPEDAPEASRILSERWANLTPEQRLSEFFTDAKTGALNERAFRLAPDDPNRPYIAVFEPPALKGMNDTFGHPVADAYFRRLGQVLQKYDATLAKVGPKFVLRLADPSMFEQIMQELATIPEFADLRPTGIVGEAGADLETVTGQLSQLREAMVGEGTLPPRGELPRGMNRRAFVEAMEQVGEAEPTAIPENLRAHFESLTPEQQFEQTYIDPATGLLSAAGFRRLPRKKYQAVVDLNFLRLANDLGSEALGDVILQKFGEKARDLGAANFDMAHISGDEYALQGDDPAAIVAFLEELRDLVGTVKVRFRNPETGQTYVFSGVSFEHGIGRSDAEAEANLNRAKERAGRRGLRGEPAFRRRVAPVEVRGDLDTDAAGDPVRGDRGRDVRGAQRFVPEAARRQVGLSRMGAVRAALRPDGTPEEFFRAVGRLYFDLALEAASQIPTTPEHQRALIDLRLDLRELAEWVGADDFQNLTDEQLDKLAEGFFVWLTEGKTPSARLTRVFEWYRLAASEVYQIAEQAEASPNLKLNDDVRSIFGKLVATDAEIEKFRTAMGDRRLFPTVQSMRRALGRPVTIDEWFEHIQKHEAAVTRASQKIRQRVLKDRLMENEAWYREKRAEYRRQAVEEYEALPERELQLLLRGEEYNPSTGRIEKIRPAPKLVYEDLVEIVGEDGARRFNTVKRARIGPVDEVWDVTELDPALLKRAAELPLRDKWVRDRAENRMKEEHPGLLDDISSLRRQIAEELHFELDPAKLLDQLVELGGQRTRGERSLQARLEAEARKIVARRIVRRKKVGEITRRELDRIMRAEQRMGDKAKKAIARGEGHLARNYVLRQMLLRYQWQETNRALKEKESFLRSIRKYQRRTHFKKLTKASPVLRDGAMAILEGLGLRRPPPDRTEQLPTMREVSAVIGSLNGTGSLVDAFDVETLGRILAQEQRFEDLSFSDMHTVALAFHAIEKAADLPTTTLDAFSGERVDSNEAAAKVIAEVQEAFPHKRPPKPNTFRTFTQKLRRFLPIFKSGNINPETLLSMVSRDPQSAVYRHIILPIQKAKQTEVVLSEGIRKKIVEKLSEIPKESRKKWSDPVDPSLFPDHTDRAEPPKTVGELIQLVFYLGAEQNIEALELGRGITYEQAMEAARRYIDKPTMDWIQSVWDAFEELWPLSREVHERAGLTTYPLTPRPLEMPWGTYKGGYMMAIYDWDAAGVVSKEEPTSLEDLFERSYVPPGTPHKHLTKRVKGFTGILSLDLMNIVRALDQHIHDIAFREAVTSVYRLLTRNDVDTAFKEHLGAEDLRNLKRWLMDVSRAQTASNTIHQVGLSGWKRHLRRAPVSARIGYRPTTALADIVNPFQAAVANDIPMGKVLAAMTRVGTSPRETFQFFLENSAEAPVLLKQFDDKLRRQLEAALENHSAPRRMYEAYVANAFIFIDQMQKIVLPTIWHAAYDHFLQQELEKDNPDAHKNASLRADAVMRNTVPTFNLADLSTVMRDTGFIGYITQFYSFLNVVLQQQYRILEPFFKARGFKDSSLALAALTPKIIAHNFLFSHVSEWIMGRGPWLMAGAGHDDEIMANIAIWFALKGTVEYALAPMPLGSDVVHAAGEIRYTRRRGLHHHSPFGAGKVGPISDALSSFHRLVSDALSGDYDAERLYKIARSISNLTGNPVHPLQTLYTAYEIINASNRIDEVEAVNMLIYGTHSETLTPPRLLTFERPRR